jgi:thymidylate synthase (FAD)
MGDDLFVANVARVSFAKESSEFTTREEFPKGSDEGIIEYLAKHNHWTPFGHPTISLRIKAPVPIRTQCFKSKVGFVENEESRRYISTTPELYVPEDFRCKPDGSIKQGSVGIHEDSKEVKITGQIFLSLQGFLQHCFT